MFRSQLNVLRIVVCVIWTSAFLISLPPLLGWNRYIYEVMCPRTYIVKLPSTNQVHIRCWITSKLLRNFNGKC